MLRIFSQISLKSSFKRENRFSGLFKYFSTADGANCDLVNFEMGHSFYYIGNCALFSIASCID